MFEKAQEVVKIGKWKISIEQLDLTSLERLRYLLINFDDYASTIDKKIEYNNQVSDILIKGVKSITKGKETKTEFNQEDIETLIISIGVDLSSLMVKFLSLGQLSEADKKK